MKRVILFAAFNLMIISHGLQASQAHLPCNIAYTIAGLADSLVDSLRAHETNPPLNAIKALQDVKESYNELGDHLTNSNYLNDDASLLFAVAAAALEYVHTHHAAQLTHHHDVISRMIILNERLSAGL